MTNIITLRPGEHFMFKNFEWVCLDPHHPDGGVLEHGTPGITLLACDNSTPDAQCCLEFDSVKAAIKWLRREE